MAVLGMVKEKAYCREKREHSQRQRHLVKSAVNMT